MMFLTGRHLLALLDHGRRSLTLLIVASVVAGLAEGAVILVVVRVAVDLASDTVSSNFVPFVGAPGGAGSALAIAAALAVATLLAHLVIARQSAALSAGVLRNARSRALRAFTAASWSTQSKQRLGALQETTATLSTLSSGLAQLLATGVANLIMLAMFLAIALVVNPLGMIIVTIAGAGIFLLIRPLTNRTRESGAAFARANSSFAQETASFAAAAMELRTFGVGEVAEQQLESVSSDTADKQRSVRFISSFGSSLYRDIAVLLLVGSVGVLSLMDTGAVGSSSAVVVLVVRSLASAHAVNAMIQSSNERGATVSLLVERIEELERGVETSGSRELDRVESFEALSVGYSYDDGFEVLTDISLSFTIGGMIGIVGPSGSGKTTLLQILLRLRRPTCGAIIVNGIDYSEYSERAWAHKVSYVSQEPTLFEGTVAANIAFFRYANRGDVERAAAEANVAAEIERLPLGFDTVLGAGGAGLSGGQKQRVAIARALLGRPEILVMDEPSSALDPRSEDLLRATLERLASQTTVIMVAHRQSTLASCDRLIEIRDGRVVADRMQQVAASPPNRSSYGNGPD